MLEGISLGSMAFISLVISFLKMPGRVKKFFLDHKMVTDIAAAGLIYIMLSAVSKSIVALVGSIFAGLAVGISIEIADAAEKDPEVKAKLNHMQNQLLAVGKEKFRQAILQIPVPSIN